MTLQLQCFAGEAVPQVVVLDGELSIGRDPHCDVRLLDQVSSRFHARVQLRKGLVYLCDQRSSNGCYVNGQRVQEQQLADGDVVQLGDVQLVVVDLDAANRQTRVVSDQGVTLALHDEEEASCWQEGDDPRALAVLHRICRALAASEQPARDLAQAARELCRAQWAAVMVRGSRLSGNMSTRLGLRLCGGHQARLLLLGRELVGETIAAEAVGSAVTAPLGDQAYVVLARGLDAEALARPQLHLLGLLAAEAAPFLKLSSGGGASELIGNSVVMRNLRERVERIARSDTTVLITGPSGSGKELVAAALHRLSGRSEGPFIAVNCAALNSMLIEAELFGHERGAFTGAEVERLGRIRAAEGGTLFLDEIGELPLESQAKLLRVLQEGQVEALGSDRPQAVNLRLVAATNRDLASMVTKGAFREDLYYRLDVLRVHTPALSQHAEDIPELAGHLLRRIVREQGLAMPRIAPATAELLCSAPWPGNVRQLDNTLMRAAVLADGDIRPEHLEMQQRQPGPPDGRFLSLAEMEARHVQAALERCAWNKSEAARLLGISRPTIHKKIGDYGLEQA